MFIKIINQIRRSFLKRGAIGTLYLIMSKLINQVKNLASSRRQAIKLHREKDLEFDIKYGVDTSGIIPQSELGIDSSNQIFGVRYEPISNIDFRQLLEDFSLRYEEYVFIDLGSGKGRAILLASSLPFKKIIGVEYSDELNSIAKNNIHLYSGERKCMDIELICMDAAKFVFPKDDSLVLFLYNPFEKPVMERVINNLTASFHEHQRRIIVLYFNPQCADIWDNISFLKKKKAMKELCIYDSGI